MDSSANLVIMPTPRGLQELKIRESRLVHWGPHRAYNQFCARELDMMESQRVFEEFHAYLKWELRFAGQFLPWR